MLNSRSQVQGPAEVHPSLHQDSRRDKSRRQPGEDRRGPWGGRAVQSPVASAWSGCPAISSHAKLSSRDSRDHDRVWRWGRPRTEVTVFCNFCFPFRGRDKKTRGDPSATGRELVLGGALCCRC